MWWAAVSGMSACRLGYQGKAIGLELNRILNLILE